MNKVSSDMSMSYTFLAQQTMSSSSPLYEYSVKNSNNSSHGSQVGQETPPNSEISCGEYHASPSPLQYTVEQTMSEAASKMTLSTRSLTRLQHRAMNENIIQW